jgi:hypothetical protein
MHIKPVMRSPSHGLIVTFALALTFAACSTAKVHTNARVAPNDLGTVAVFSFAGTQGELMGDRITYELLQHGVSVISRQRIERLVTQTNTPPAMLNPQTWESPSRLMQLCANLGADTAVVGYVIPSSEQQPLVRHFTEAARDPSPYTVERAGVFVLKRDNGATLAEATLKRDKKMNVAEITYHGAAKALVSTLIEH